MTTDWLTTVFPFLSRPQPDGELSEGPEAGRNDKCPSLYFLFCQSFSWWLDYLVFTEIHPPLWIWEQAIDKLWDRKIDEEKDVERNILLYNDELWEINNILKWNTILICSRLVTVTDTRTPCSWHFVFLWRELICRLSVTLSSHQMDQSEIFFRFLIYIRIPTSLPSTLWQWSITSHSHQLECSRHQFINIKHKPVLNSNKK